MRVSLTPPLRLLVFLLIIGMGLILRLMWMGSGIDSCVSLIISPPCPSTAYLIDVKVDPLLSRFFYEQSCTSCLAIALPIASDGDSLAPFERVQQNLSRSERDRCASYDLKIKQSPQLGTAQDYLSIQEPSSWSCLDFLPQN